MHSPHLAQSLKSLRGRPVEDVVYQAVTLAAIVIVLATIWAF